MTINLLLKKQLKQQKVKVHSLLIIFKKLTFLKSNQKSIHGSIFGLYIRKVRF